MKKIFTTYSEDSENNIQISVIDIEAITDELKEFIDENIHQ